jgi:hypothetical protein
VFLPRGRFQLLVLRRERKCRVTVHTEDFSFIGDCSQQHCFYATSTPAEMFDLFCSAFHVVGTPSFMHTKLHTDVEIFVPSSHSAKFILLGNLTPRQMVVPAWIQLSAQYRKFADESLAP